MSLLWEHQHLDTHYSVRSSGGAIRLYTNRVFHSQWNPRVPFSGGIWDCLSLPALHKQPGQIGRVLLLGVGGGAVINQLQEIDSSVSVTAIELDEQHLKIARNWFKVGGENISLIHDDAISWLYSYDGPPFDIIIDDLFGHDEGEPIRACALELSWLELMYRHLNDDGLLVANCINSVELIQALPTIGAAGFKAGYRWHLPTYENIIGVFAKQSLHARQWSRNLETSDLSVKDRSQARTIVRRPLRALTDYTN